MKTGLVSWQLAHGAKTNVKALVGLLKCRRHTPPERREEIDWGEITSELLLAKAGIASILETLVELGEIPQTLIEKDE